MNIIKPTTAILLALFFVPLVSAQAPPGTGDAFLGMPHAVTLKIGANEVDVTVQGDVQCDEGFAAPPPMHVRVTSGIFGSSDENGPAWSFDETDFKLNWTLHADNLYTIDETLAIPVTGNGYGARGVSGEFAVASNRADNDTCSSNGFTLPTKSGHAHISVPARPADNQAPGLSVVLVAVGLLALARWRA